MFQTYMQPLILGHMKIENKTETFTEEGTGFQNLIFMHTMKGHFTQILAFNFLFNKIKSDRGRVLTFVTIFKFYRTSLLG